MSDSKNIIRIDGPEKVNGKAIYGDDVQIPNMLYAASRLTDIIAGRITSIDTTTAENMPGVVAIALYKDIPGQKRLGPIRQDQYIIVDKEVFYSGDVIAVVAAKTRTQAQDAAEAIDIQYEPYDPISTIDEATAPDARCIHQEYDSNYVLHYPMRKGNVDDGFKASDQVIERTYSTGYQEHAYIEPESLVVAPPTDKQPKFEVYGSVQNPYSTRKNVADFLGLDVEAVNVKSSVIGGSFGGKDDHVSYLACRAALLAKMTNCPINLTLSRESSMLQSYKRHPYQMTYKVGFNNDGRLNAMKIDILADSGAYSSQTFFVTWRSVVQATGPYQIPHVQTDIRGVYTNNVYTGAYRGFGAPQVIFAQESLMDEVAKCCNISPVAIRLLNGFKQNSITAGGQCLSKHTVSLHEVIQKATEAADYDAKRVAYKKKNEESERFKYGIGLSCSYRGCSLGAEGEDKSTATIHIRPDGQIEVATAVHENGQGLGTTMSIIAANALGVDFTRITFMPSQTDAVPDGGPTVASRGTLVGGNAILNAAEQIKQRLFEHIKADLGVSELKQTSWKNDAITSLENDASIPFVTAVEKAMATGEDLSVIGWFNGPAVSWDEETGQGDAYFTYVYGCQIAEVKLDTHTGKLEVQHITAAHDMGKAINRIGALGQIYGGVAQGMGYAFLEDLNVQKSELKSLNFDEYLIPTISDMPTVTSIIVENADCYGPNGAKSLGEPTLELTAAAVNNAFAAASGTVNRHQPITLEQAFLGVNLRKPSRASESHCDHQAGGKTTAHARLKNVDITTPATLDEALQAIATDSYAPLAGGTDLMVSLRKEPAGQKLINIYSLPELQGITEETDCIVIGAAATISSVLNHPTIQKQFPLLCEAMVEIGSKQIRNRATLAGNIANAAPCGDSIPPLLVYDATLTLQSATGKRTIPLSEFITGAYKTVLRSDELLTSINIPRFDQTGSLGSTYKLGRRNALNISRLSFTLRLRVSDTNVIEAARCACGAVFSRPTRLEGIEKLVMGKPLNEDTIGLIQEPLATLIDEEIGGRWSSKYKEPVFIHLVEDAFRSLCPTSN